MNNSPVSCDTGLSRRQALALGAAVLGLASLAVHELSCHRHVNTGLSVAELGSFALESQKGQRNYYSEPSFGLDFYQLVLGIKFARYYKHMVDDMFQGVVPLIVADVGGCSGTAAYEMNKRIPFVQAFNIDIMMHIPPPGQGLSAERHIVKPIENTGLPDQTFHHLFSHNASQYFDLARALPEFYRLAKVGGGALLDLQDWKGALETLDRFEYKDNTVVTTMSRMGFAFRGSLQKFIEFGRGVQEGASNGLGLLMPRVHMFRLPLGEKIKDVEQMFKVAHGQTHDVGHSAEEYVKLFQQVVERHGPMLAAQQKWLQERRLA